jgi:hypothetical protein
MDISKALIKTTKSQLDLQMADAEASAKGRKGIQFYCSKRHIFIFIPSTEGQTTNYKALKHD